MKKSVVLFALFFSMIGLQAQTIIVNSDFEMWSYGKPVNWTVGLHGAITSPYMNIPVEVNFGTQSNEAHSGNSAVRLAAADFSIPILGGSYNLPGILQAGESEGFSIPMEDLLNIIQILQDTTGFDNFDSTDLSAFSSLVQLLSPGVPCEKTPAAVSAWVKYQQQDDDQIMMFAITKENGMPVDYAYKEFNINNPNAYQEIGVTFENAGADCDSIMIIIVSAMSLNSASVLYVDDISLVFSGVGVDSHKDFTESVYPNPATSVLNIDVNDGREYQWTLRDLTGRTLQSGKSEGKSTLNVKQYPAGIYMLTLKVDGYEHTRKVVIR